MSNNLVILDRIINFPYDVSVLQEKVDILLVSSKLLGYEIATHRSSEVKDGWYYIEIISGDRDIYCSIDISFDSYGGAKEILMNMRTIMSLDNIHVYKGLSRVRVEEAVDEFIKRI